MKSSGFRLNKLELLLSLAVVSFIGGPIGYRVYQIYNTFPRDAETHSFVVRVASAKTDGLKLAEYVVVSQEDLAAGDMVMEPTTIDFNSRLLSRLNLCNMQIFPDNADEIIPFNRAEIKPMYSFRENILLFVGKDSSIPQAAGQ